MGVKSLETRNSMEALVKGLSFFGGLWVSDRQAPPREYICMQEVLKAQARDRMTSEDVVAQYVGALRLALHWHNKEK
eukprot:CAMPEP_0206445696 /NCGR_PEP_ID=MMETSP0324_2-20121206/15668_1 /ASSEMBLY_ACC=CAM_ASM_000836 /TAXON_ID=2866 /ORGANISM="Crypthecodinium cohnii, Strain Seligo" /LENGTH=76 /DNA_ID=CAMNT_0053913973 /DNA_START=261 /DNA_END=488 /DNA_ORIENTATION=-